MNDFLCGAVAGAAADTCLFPFDTVRARMMTRSSHVKGGVLLEMMNLIRLDGARALYKGLPAHLLACIPGNGVFYFTYQAAKEAMEAHVHSEAARHAISASLGCLASLVIYTPMEVVKQRVMVSNTVGSRLMLQNILAQGGVRELYRGFAAGALTWVPYLSLYFLLYESLLNRLPRALTDPKHNADSPSHLSEEVPFFAALGCGVAAGFGAAALTNPFDVVRTKVRATFRSCVRSA